MNEIREEIGKMSRSQLSDALYTIELRARKTLEHRRDEYTPAQRARWDFADEVVDVIVNSRTASHT